ncbi:MAG: HAMP domain-containing sensor histidine kinase [Lachnospiraceae bacterium]|nr:HAMP domain-containing sensor histidine kinase [Lachnospiraceae bacterium]
MKQSHFQKKVYGIFMVSFLVTITVPVILYGVTKSLLVSGIASAGLLSCFGLTLLLHYMEDVHTRELVLELSRLMDTLLELEEKEVFPDSEDTIVSKLQSRVLKLIRILRQKNRQSWQEQENMKSLISDISHQLKTPLSNLKMYSEFLEQENLSEIQRKQYTDIVCASVERLEFLAENMIKISRLESGLIHLAMEEQSLNETVLKAVKDVYPKAKQKNVELVYKEDSHIFICHDRNWTAEAVFNLLENAVKYSCQGGQVILRVRKLGMFAEVSVEDENGPIKEEERTKVFSRFYRGENSRNQEGIGIGLYLAREIVMKQKGYMKLTMTEKGNQFSIVLYRDGAQ